MDNPRTWVASSVLELPLARDMHRSPLRCVALHESYSAKAEDITVFLDVRYPPEVKLLGAPVGDLEEGLDTVELRCAADANPPAKVMWRRAGRPEVAAVDEVLAFRPLARAHSGAYSCQAHNALGSSQPLSVDIDVKYILVGYHATVLALLANKNNIVIHLNIMFFSINFIFSIKHINKRVNLFSTFLKILIKMLEHPNY
ncbi:Irregular chiasm C-roughest protein, partial [Gryllus bimaculatus]